jgi:hypothetical protein
MTFGFHPYRRFTKGCKENDQPSCSLNKKPNMMKEDHANNREGPNGNI